MHRTYFMQSERIGFSQWQPSDLPLARQLWGDPQVTQYLCADGKFSEEEICRRLHTEISNANEHHIQYWPIFQLKTGAFLGCCGLRPHDAASYEIGFHLLPEFWGQGYGWEAASTVIRHAFLQLHAQKLFAGHHPQNFRSKRLLEKLGFTPIGDQFYAPTGLNHPSYELTTSRSE